MFLSKKRNRTLCSRTLLVAPGIATRNKKLLVAKLRRPRLNEVAPLLVHPSEPLRRYASEATDLARRASVRGRFLLFDIL